MNADERYMESYFRMQMLGFKTRQANFKHTPSAEGALIYCLQNSDTEAARIICLANGWTPPAKKVQRRRAA